MEKNTIYDIKQTLDIIQEQKHPVNLLALNIMYIKCHKKYKNICIILQKLGYNAIIRHRLSSESTIRVMKE